MAGNGSAPPSQGSGAWFAVGCGGLVAFTLIGLVAGWFYAPQGNPHNDLGEKAITGAFWGGVTGAAVWTAVLCVILVFKAVIGLDRRVNSADRSSNAAE
jgi:hypothetical protein